MNRRFVFACLTALLSALCMAPGGFDCTPKGTGGSSTGMTPGGGIVIVGQKHQGKEYDEFNCVVENYGQCANQKAALEKSVPPLEKFGPEPIFGPIDLYRACDEAEAMYALARLLPVPVGGPPELILCSCGPVDPYTGQPIAWRVARGDRSARQAPAFESLGEGDAYEAGVVVYGGGDETAQCANGCDEIEGGEQACCEAVAACDSSPYTTCQCWAACVQDGGTDAVCVAQCGAPDWATTTAYACAKVSCGLIC